VYICYDEAQKFENSVGIFMFKGATNNVYSITKQAFRVADLCKVLLRFVGKNIFE
jgi:hypothetical protein